MRERDITLDCIRIFAVFSVISIHFFWNSGYYDQIFHGKRILLMTIMRSFFMICVPLFIILTGYLMGDKILSLKYYLRIQKTIGTYFLASIACVLYKVIWQGTQYTLKSFFLGVLDFTAADYAWYIEMYIGLYLLIPFLNLIYKGLNNQKQKQVLIVTLLILTVGPATMNIFNFNDAEWWLHPVSSMVYQKIFPAWWSGIYPLLYYYIGCYIKEYNLKMNIKKSIIWTTVCTILLGILCFYRSYGSTFVWGSWADYNSLFVVIMSCLAFNIIHKCTWLNRCPFLLKKGIKKLSGLVLGIYLVSYIFDTIFYTVLQEKVTEISCRWKYYFVIVPVIFLCSMCLSIILDIIYKEGEKLFRGIGKLSLNK